MGRNRGRRTTRRRGTKARLERLLRHELRGTVKHVEPSPNALARIRRRTRGGSNGQS